MRMYMEFIGKTVFYAKGVGPVRMAVAGSKGVRWHLNYKVASLRVDQVVPSYAGLYYLMQTDDDGHSVFIDSKMTYSLSEEKIRVRVEALNAQANKNEQFVFKNNLIVL